MEAGDLTHVRELLSWDQQTYMPPGGAPARARQLEALEVIAHQKRTAPAIGQLLDELHPYEADLAYDSDDASLLRLTRQEYDRATRIPGDFMARFAAHNAEIYDIWTRARPDNDFAAVRPYLEKTLDLSRQMADFFPGYEHIADPLIDFADYGMKANSIRTLFAQLRERLVPLVEAITAQPLLDDSAIKRFFPKQQQLVFSEQVAKKLGYEFERGRQDLTHHPFMTKFSLGDTRITTRINEHDLVDGLYSTIHEVGHALYEQGIDLNFEALPLGGGTSSGVHESQSRLWENIVGRSRGFCEYLYPELQAAFPGTLDNVPVEAFYQAINKVQRSLIRTEADEVTYNLHVMIRFDLELAMLEGKLEIRDLPEAWNARYKSDLGVVAPDDRNGVLQDVHWYSGPIGGQFQGYTLGNILSGQFYAAALKANPAIPEQVAQGEFAPLLTWLRANIYRHGSKFTADELVQQVTGSPMSIEPYLAYLQQKYGEL
ncbi:MAG: carboxypeptidase M32, partial [Anaerolineae bacterium]|nr:carboxypeptidase M32 [Anaerolineae bacterium]